MTFWTKLRAAIAAVSGGKSALRVTAVDTAGDGITPKTHGLSVNSIDSPVIGSMFRKSEDGFELLVDRQLLLQSLNISENGEHQTHDLQKTIIEFNKKIQQLN